MVSQSPRGPHTRPSQKPQGPCKRRPTFSLYSLSWRWLVTVGPVQKPDCLLAQQRHHQQKTRSPDCTPLKIVKALLSLASPVTGSATKAQQQEDNDDDSKTRERREHDISLVLLEGEGLCRWAFQQFVERPLTSEFFTPDAMKRMAKRAQSPNRLLSDAPKKLPCVLRHHDTPCRVSLRKSIQNSAATLCSFFITHAGGPVPNLDETAPRYPRVDASSEWARRPRLASYTLAGLNSLMHKKDPCTRGTASPSCLCSSSPGGARMSSRTVPCLSILVCRCRSCAERRYCSRTGSPCDRT